MNFLQNLLNFKKKPKKYKKVKEMMIVGKKDLEGQQIKSKDIIDALWIPVNAPMVPKVPSINI